MTGTIIRKEILENILSYRFPLFLIICVLLIVSAFYVNYIDYSKRLNDYNEQKRLSADAIAASRMWDVTSGSVALKAFRPPAPLSVVAYGFERSLPLYYEFQTDGFKAGETSVGDESILSILGRIDFVFILEMILSLIVLLFASDMVSGEKEMGTLRGTLSNSVPRHALLLGKLIGGSIAVWIPLLIAILLGMLLLDVSPYPLLTPPIPVNLLLILGSAFVFIFSYFTIGIAVSASTSRARTSLIAVFLTWIVLQLIIPKLTDVIASAVRPIRTETVVSMQKSLLLKSLDEERGKILGERYEHIFGAGAKISTEPGTPEERAQWDAFKKEVDERYKVRKARELAGIDEKYEKEKEAQRAIANSISLVSPSAAFSRLVTDLAGTGELAKLGYLDAVRRYSTTLQEQLYSHVDRTTLILPSGGTASMSSIDKMVDLHTLPAFTVSPQGAGEVFAADAGSLISLAFWLVGPFIVAFVRFLRYDVR
ncbi:MAG TPA: ABC transporter permease subunit [Bacteroidota bacterium]|nr:ABC transporter permease subunit [Bacteroidota bacterium]